MSVEWQRTTALRKIERDRAAARSSGTPANEARLIAGAAAYVGASVDQVRRWAEGRS